MKITVNTQYTQQPDMQPYSQGLVWLLLLVALLALQYLMTMYLVTMRARMSVFTKEFMAKFQTEHHEACPGQSPPKFGYPDTGNGRYGKALPYADWYKMQNGQRAQINFLEQITFTIGMSVLTALNSDFTFWAVGLLAGFSVGRVLFTLGYSKMGPNARIPGAILQDLALLGLIVLPYISAAKL